MCVVLCRCCCCCCCWALAIFSRFWLARDRISPACYCVYLGMCQCAYVYVCTGHIQQNKDLSCAHTQIDVKILLLCSLYSDLCAMLTVCVCVVQFLTLWNFNKRNQRLIIIITACTLYTYTYADHTNSARIMHTNASIYLHTIFSLLSHCIDIYTDTHTHIHISFVLSFNILDWVKCAWKWFAHDSQILQLFGRQNHRIYIVIGLKFQCTLKSSSQTPFLMLSIQASLFSDSVWLIWFAMEWIGALGEMIFKLIHYEHRTFLYSTEIPLAYQKRNKIKRKQ